MKNEIYKTLLVTVALVGTLSCSEVEFRDPLDGDTSKPWKVALSHVKSFSGGATIYYELPKDNKVRYVLAEYKLDDGTIKQNKSSFFSDSIIVKGFASTKEYPVNLYTVSYAEVKSDPTTIYVKPKLPPYLVAKESLTTKGIFGGINISYNNPTGAEIEVTIMKRPKKPLNELDKLWTTTDRFVRTNTAVSYDIRSSGGMAPVETEFALIFKDRYNNVSDTIKKNVTPLYEQLLDKSKMKPYPWEAGAKPIPGDVWVQHMNPTSNGVACLWDNIKSDISLNIYFTKSDTKLPQGVSIDLGATSILSRIVLWPRNNAVSYYGHAFPRRIEVYGSNDPGILGTEITNGVTKPDSQWTLIKDLECVTPSGAKAIADVTAEDKELVRTNGHNYDLSSETITPYRYIRIWTTAPWAAGSNFVVIAEMDVYGDYAITE